MKNISVNRDKRNSLMTPSILSTINIVVKKKIKIKFRNLNQNNNLLQLTSWMNILMKLITIEKEPKRLTKYSMPTSISNYKRRSRLYPGRIKNYLRILQPSKRLMSKLRLKYSIINRKSMS